MLEGWFLDVPLINIHFGNMTSWSAWAFFGKDIKDLSQEEQEENIDIVKYIEQVAKWRFPPGISGYLYILNVLILCKLTSYWMWW